MTQPNIIYVVSDDQPKGLLDAMPFVTNTIKNQGLFFNNGLSPTSLCSPARASILSGNLPNKHGVWTNEPEDNGGWIGFNDNETDTLATRLQAAGYSTALVGKYINLFKFADTTYIPPGWDQFISMSAGSDGEGGAGAYYDYTIIGTSYNQYHGTSEADYSTDVLRNHAVEVVSNTPETRPLFLYFTPWAPHSNYEAAPRHVGTWPLEPASSLPGSFNESNMTDKPQWMQDNPLAVEADERQHLTSMHEAVMAIDEACEAIWNALGPTRQANTIFVFTSDNGKMLGSHRIVKKDMPHRWSAEIPLAIRGPGITPGETNRVTPHIDVTAYLAEQGGVTGWDIDGKSCIGTGRVGVACQQKDNYKDQKHPGYIGYRTETGLYVEYTNGLGKEYYDYTTDANELNNLIGSQNQAIKDAISMHRTRARNATPYPPGFVLV